MQNHITIKLITASLLMILLVALPACGKKEVETKADKSETELSIDSHAALNKAQDAANAIEEKNLSMEEKLESFAINVPDMQEVYADGNKYMDWFSKRPNVQRTESGLLYRVTQQGDGPMPARENTVSVNYRGTFPNGEVFDSSYREGKPIQFGVTRVIPGWTEMLLMMNEGSKVEVVIPPELAYGERGAGGIIPGNQVLKFEIELLDADFKKQ